MLLRQGFQCVQKILQQFPDQIVLRPQEESGIDHDLVVDASGPVQFLRDRADLLRQNLFDASVDVIILDLELDLAGLNVGEYFLQAFDQLIAFFS